MGHDGDMWQLLLSILAAHAAPDAAALSAAWAAVSQEHAAHGRVPVSLKPDDFEELAKGEVVRRLLPGQGMLAAQGAIYSPDSPSRIWVTIQDPEHLNLAREDLPLQRLPGSTAARRLNYQMVKTPWPLADRQQVFTVQASAGLYASSGKRVWERSVALADRALATDADPDAIWLEHLAGGFVVVSVPEGGSLTVLRVEADPGGRVPADIVSRLSSGTLGRSLKRLRTYAESAAAHYDVGHDTVLYPDGQPMVSGTF